MDGTEQQPGLIGLSSNELSTVELWLHEQHQIGPIYTEPFFELIRRPEFWGQPLNILELQYTPAQREFLSKLWPAYDVHKSSRSFCDEMFAASIFIHDNRLDQLVTRQWLMGYIVAHLDQLRATHWLGGAAFHGDEDVSAMEVADALAGVDLPESWDFARWLMMDFLPLHLRLFRALQIKLEILATQEAREVVSS